MVYASGDCDYCPKTGLTETHWIKTPDYETAVCELCGRQLTITWVNPKKEDDEDAGQQDDLFPG